MITVNMYGLLPNKRIQEENLPIFRSVENLLNGMREELKKITEVHTDQTFSFSFPIEVIKDYETRVRVFANIPNMIINEDAKAELLRDGSKFQMRTYLILPYGEALLIKDFDKIYNNLQKIEELGINKIKENDRTSKETFEQFRDKMLKLKGNATTVGERMRATTGLAYVYELIDNFIEDHRVDLQSKMYASIKEVREEQEANAELLTELDMINKHAKTVLKDDNEDNFLQCIYNGEEISQIEMLNKLSNHMIYREDVENEEQIFIGDTLDDEYRIETEKLIITRDPGGKIKISVK